MSRRENSRGKNSNFPARHEGAELRTSTPRLNVCRRGTRLLAFLRLFKRVARELLWQVIGCIVSVHSQLYIHNILLCFSMYGHLGIAGHSVLCNAISIAINLPVTPMLLNEAGAVLLFSNSKHCRF